MTDRTREQQLNDALLVTNFFLTEICEQLDIDPATSMTIRLRGGDKTELIKEYTLEECLYKNKDLLVKDMK